MENGISKQRKARKDGDNCRRVWLRKEEEALLVALKDICSSGWKSENGSFRAGYNVVLEKTMIEALPGTDLRAVPHIESKIKVWKRYYSCLASILEKPEFGWNCQENSLIVYSDEAWEDHVKKDGNAKGLRYKSFPHYKDWKEIFGKDRATGELAEANCYAVEMEKDGEFDGLYDVEPSISITQAPTQQISKKRKVKRQKRSSGDEVSGLLAVSKAFGTFCEDVRERFSVMSQRMGYEHDLSKARREVNGLLSNIPFLEMKDRLKAASLIVSQPQRVDLFMSLNNEEKAQWVAMLLNGEV